MTTRTTESNTKLSCDELLGALNAARAEVETLRTRTDTNVNDVVTHAGSAIPEVAQPDVMKDIEEIEQAMREAGCPEAH